MLFLGIKLTVNLARINNKFINHLIYLLKDEIEAMQ